MKSQPSHHNSLSEVHHSVNPESKKKGWRKILAYLGPAYLISVGYMDPGNWATDIAGGSAFGYSLIWVLLMSNLMALLLQSFSARLGIVQGKDLAQCNRSYYPKGLNFILYILAELAIAACDLAEVLGMAIGLNLLFGFPLLWGVVISILDTFLLLYLQRLGIRKLEAFIIGLISVIGVCFWIELMWIKPSIVEISKGFIPTLPNTTALYIAIGIIGATVMPHNLYLHSSLVQTRKIGTSKEAIKKAIKYNFLDSAIALNLAFFVNAAILIIAASVFYKAGLHQVASMEEAHQLLAPMLGHEWSSHLFAIALIAAGQSSTVTGTLAGQIVMEGYLQIRMNPTMRRILTRLIAVVPTVIVILVFGEKEVNAMLIFSQVILSMQLAFAIIPLIHFVSDKKQMGDFAIGVKSKIAGWLIAIIVITLNLWQIFTSGFEWIIKNENILIKIGIILSILAYISLLVLTTIYPLILKRAKVSHTSMHPDACHVLNIKTQKTFNNIALALDFSIHDKIILEYACSIAKSNSTLYLIHVIESASAITMGEEALDNETQEDNKIMNQYIQYLKDKGYNAIGQVAWGHRVNTIAKIIKQQQVDLLVVGSHGHRSIKDLFLGETVNSLRHKVNVPILIAQ